MLGKLYTLKVGNPLPKNAYNLLIVRSTKNIGDSTDISNFDFVHEPTLSPSLELFRKHLELKKAGKWTKDTYTDFFVPAFKEEMLREPMKSSVEDIVALLTEGHSVSLICWCSHLCHRHIIADYIEGQGFTVIREDTKMVNPALLGGSLAKLEAKISNQKQKRVRRDTTPKVLGELQKVTPVALKTTLEQIPAKNIPTNIEQPIASGTIPAIPVISKKQKDIMLSSGVVYTDELPMGYHAIGKNDLPKLMRLKENIIRVQITAFDYETDGNPDDVTQDPQDHELVGVSFSYQIGQAFYMPIMHDTYGANISKEWFIENFLKPILEHPDILLIAHNVKFEHQVSLCLGIDMFPKALTGKVMDTMIMVKALALPETVVQEGDTYEVRVGLKFVMKALLADSNGVVHNLVTIDNIKDFKDIVGKTSWEEPVAGEFYKSGAKKGTQKTKKMTRSRTFNELPVDKEVIDYGCLDSDGALGLYYHLLPFCHSEEVYDAIVEIDIPRMMVLGEYELAGWHINRDRLEGMGVIADKAIAEIDPPLQQGLIDVTKGFASIDEEGSILVPIGRYPMGSWRGDDVYLTIKNEKPFSWGSTQHLQWLFFYVLGVQTGGLERSKITGLPSTGADSIDTILDRYESTGGDSFMNTLKEKRKYQKIKSTYVGIYNEETGQYEKGMLPFCREDTHKIHTNLRLVSTWRLASKKPNLQNIPRAENDPMGIRAVFEAPTYDMKKDYSSLNTFTKPVSIISEKKLSGITVWVGADYSQIELKVLAWYAGEASMINTLAHGGDLHSTTAVEVFKLDCLPAEVKERYKPYRYKAKAVNFGLVYGLTEFGLSKDPKMGMTVEQARVFIEQYMQTYTGVHSYSTEIIAFARKYGYVETMFKHRRPIPEINHPNKWVRKKGENKAMNSPIQGSASDIMALAMVNVRKDAPNWLKPVIQIHDELICECPVEYASEGAFILKDIMERPIEGFSEIMPIVAEPSVGKIWAHALDIEKDEKGVPYVKPKRERKELSDVTFADIEYMLPLYKMAGIDVRG